MHNKEMSIKYGNVMESDQICKVSLERSNFSLDLNKKEPDKGRYQGQMQRHCGSGQLADLSNRIL